MTSAAAVATSIADRVIDEDQAIALHEPAGEHVQSVVDRVMALLREAAATDGIDAQEAEDIARAAGELAALAWLDSPAGKAALLAASRAIARDRKVIGHGLASKTARTVERVGPTTIAARLEERNSPRAGSGEPGAAAGDRVAGSAPASPDGRAATARP